MKRVALPRRCSAFTLVELLVVVAIIGLMLNLLYPALSSAIARANSIKCTANLRSIGVAAAMYATDNNNCYPTINQVANANPPVYDASVQGLVGVLGPYGISADTIKCPVDVSLGASASCNNLSYPNPGSSYEWDPVFDDEPVNATVVYITPTVPITVNSSKVRLAMDFSPIHHNRPNVVYGDGHVSNH